jgi:8-oxo-dGTP pyrophosphatase MutT (NUDIX family)
MTVTDRARDGITRLLDGIRPWDGTERTHLARAREWVGSGAPLHRVRKPDVPPVHLVAYFVVRDGAAGRLLLVAHRKSGLWLPSGGHVEPGEDPWRTVVRACRDELHIDAGPSPVAGRRPFFLTVTGTRGQGRHTDVSLWYLLRADADSVTSFDQREFSAIRWLTPEEVLAEPAHTLDPHMHRFTRKLLAAEETAAGGDLSGGGPCGGPSPRRPGP